MTVSVTILVTLHYNNFGDAYVIPPSNPNGLAAGAAVGDAHGLGAAAELGPARNKS